MRRANGLWQALNNTGIQCIFNLVGRTRFGSVGPAVPGVKVRIAEDGEIVVKGPNVFKGYWRMPEKTAEELRDDGFFITGDLGLIDDRGYVQIVGRGKDLIISGGFNVYPKEVETAIDALPDVVESAVIGVPHADFGEGVVAVVVARADVTEDAVLAGLGDLARFKQPKRVVLVEELPRNTMGKVQKNLLREVYAQIFKPSRL